jgi:hypothetical protein
MKLNIKNKLIKIAYENPELRGDLLSILFKLNKKAELTKEENQAVKKLYSLIKNEMEKFKKFCFEELPDLFNKNGIIEEKNINEAKVKIPSLFRRSYTPSNAFKKDPVLGGLEIKDISEFKDKIKQFSESFRVKLVNDSSSGPASNTGHYLHINPTAIFNTNDLEFKSILQHELQHLAQSEVDEDHKIIRDEGDTEYHKSIIRYLGSKHEVDAHAKQYAYIYYKLYPEDNEIDLKKLIKAVNEKVPTFKKTIESYLISFKLDNSDISKHYDDSEKEKVQEIRRNFIKKLNTYFKCYKDK